MAFMRNRSRFVASTFALALAGLLAACGSSSKSSSSASSGPGNDKAAFCRDNGDLDAATIKVSSPSELAQVFKDNSSKLDHLLNIAPSEVKADTQLLVDTAKVVAATGDPSPFIGDAKLRAAGQHLDSFCGINTTTTSDTGSSSSSTSASSSASSTFEFSS